MKHSTPQNAVRAFADNALEKGRDRWSGENTPLFADGIHVESGKPVEWLHQGEKHVVSKAQGNGLGDIGERPGEGIKLSQGSDCADPAILLALLELFRGAEDARYLALARIVGDNILEQKFHNNLFVESAGQSWARFDAVEPLALLHLQAAEENRVESVPDFIGGARRYLQGPYDGQGRSTDQKLFYGPEALFRSNAIK